MPTMRRSEIIEKYGFDPLAQDESGGASVVEKGQDTQPVTVGDPKAPDLQETGSAGVVDNLQAGAVKSVLSDPLMLFGLAVGATDYALGKMGVTQDGTFEEQLFVDGGAEQVKNHIQEYADKVKSEHPDWDRNKVLGEVDRYRLTEDFFNYTTDRMKPGLSKGLKNALWVNKETGVNKLPTQETTTDSIAQALGGLILPMPPIADFAARALGRVGNSAAARAAIHVADALVTPGTQASHYGVAPVAAGTAVNLGLDQVQRTASGDPNLLREDAFWDFSKMHAQLPNEAELTVPPGGSVPPQPLQTGDRIADAWNTNDAALATAGAGAAIAAAALGGRSLVRRFRPNVPTPGALERSGGNVLLSPDAPTIRDQALDNMQRRGFDVPERGRVIEPIVRDLLPDEIAGTEIADRVRIPTAEEINDAVAYGVDQDAAIKNAARDTGGHELERDVDAVVGTIMSPAARASGTNRFFESGIFPDGSRSSIRPRDFVATAQGMDQADVDTFIRGNLARNELDARDEVLNYSSQRYIDALNERRQYTGTNASDIQRLDAAVADERARMQEHFNDTVNTRHAYTNTSSQELRQHVADQEANPRAMELETQLRRLNTDLVNFERRAHLLTPEAATERLQRPWHSSLFEVQRRGFLKRMADATPDVNRGRGTEYEFEPPGAVKSRVTVEKSVDAFQSLGQRAAATIDRAQYVIGAHRALRMMTNADPMGRFIQYRGAAASLGDAAPPPERSITLPVNGVDHVWETNLPRLARAFKQQPIDLGLSFGIANNMRKLAQLGFTGPISPGAIGTAFRSLGFDMSGAMLTRPEGRSFGLVGSTMRRWTGATDPTSTLSRVIDKLEVLDAFAPTASIQVLSALAQMPYWKFLGKAGQGFMDAAISQNGVLGRIAQLPGGQQFLRNAGAQMMRAFESTPLALMQRYNVFTPHAQLVDSFNVRVREDKIMKKWENAGRDSSQVIKTGKLLWGGWVSGLDNIHNAAKLAYFAQNYAALEARYGRGRVPVHEVRRLANESKNLGGNMQALPGSPVVAKVASTIPYANMMMQATALITNALVHQGLNQRVNVVARIAGLAGTAYAGYQMMEEMGLTDWMYEKLNDWDRVGHIFIPTAENVINKARTGSYIKPDLENGDDPTKYFYRVKMAPEIATIVAPYIAGMEAFGLINRGRNLSNSSIPKDLRSTIMSHIGSANIPGVSLAFSIAGQGTSVDFLRAGEGRGVVQSAPMLKGMGINSDRTPGGLPTFATGIATTLFGTVGAMLTTTLDAGLKEYNAGGEAIAALAAAGEQTRATYRQSLPSVPGLWKAEEKAYSTSPLGNRVYDTQAKMKAINSQYNIEFGTGSGRENANRISDPEVRRMVFQAHGFFERGGYPKLEKRINQYRQQLEDLTLARGRSPSEVAAEKRQIIQSMQNVQERMATLAERFNERIADRYGQRFEQDKVSPDLDGIIDLAKKYSGVRQRGTP